MTNYKDCLTKLHQNLNILQERNAKYGGNAPLDLLNQIEDHQKAIVLTEQALVGKLGHKEWQGALQPLLVAIDQRAAANEVSQVSIGEISGEMRDSIIAGRDVHVVIYNYPPAPPPAPAPTEILPQPIPANPYRGLFAFRPEHTHLFFGRTDFTEQLVQTIDSRPLVAVLGASGSGKSSVVFAGLVPELLKRPAEKWLFTTFRPGVDPFLGLSSALVPLYETTLSKTDQIVATRKLSTNLQKGDVPLADVLHTIHQTYPDHRLLLITDQFEELYTQVRESETRQQFIDMLLTLVDAGQDPSWRLVLTLRADFLGQASLYAPLAEALNREGATRILGPMARTQLTEAIEKPAELRGVRFETKLVKRLLDDVGQEEGSLPLLEFALTELWQHQQQRTLTHVAYDEIGEVKGALSRHADQAFQRLTPTEQEQARRIFVQLVNPGTGTEDTRRLAYRSELEQDWSLVAELANERLVVTNQVKGKQDTVEIVHEALIRHWGQLRKWMDEDRTFRAWQERLRFTMGEWQAAKDDSALLRKVSLAEAEGWLIKRPSDLSPTEKEFINASLARRQKQKQQRKLFLIEVIVATFVMAGLAVFSFIQFQVATVERSKAEISEAIAISQKATAEAAGTVIAQQKEATEAELKFYQTADPQIQINYLVNLLNRSGYEGQATKLFWGLPSQKNRVDLFKVKDDRLEGVIQKLDVTLADVNRTGYSDSILSAMVEALATSGQNSELKTELEVWRQVRKIARDKPDQVALAGYDRLISLNDRNPAYRYERAAVQVELANYQTALDDLEQVMSSLDNPVFATSGLIESGADFATVEQVTRAVRRLIEITPGLGHLLNNSASSYPHLQQFDLVLVPTPTPITNKMDEAKMVLVPTGPFEMGSDYGVSSEQPVHWVTLSAFFIDQYEVTNAQYRHCVEAGVCKKPECPGQTYDDKSKENHPVVCVSWTQAKTYCEWRDGRLPTEAEWEKAARGIDGRTYPWGEHLAPHLARYHTSEGTMPVGYYPEGISPYGAYDMMGNVWEWVADWFEANYYSNSPTENPPGPQEGDYKVIRGGSWYFNDVGARVTFRNQYRSPSTQSPYIGFRCAGTP